MLLCMVRTQLAFLGRYNSDLTSGAHPKYHLPYWYLIDPHHMHIKWWKWLWSNGIEAIKLWANSNGHWWDGKPYHRRFIHLTWSIFHPLTVLSWRHRWTPLKFTLILHRLYLFLLLHQVSSLSNKALCRLCKQWSWHWSDLWIKEISVGVKFTLCLCDEVPSPLLAAGKCCQHQRRLNWIYWNNQTGTNVSTVWRLAKTDTKFLQSPPVVP